MRSPYSGSFEFDEGDEPPPPQPRTARPAAAAGLAAPLPPPPTAAAALPAGQPCGAAGSGPPRLLYIKSDRLAQLSEQLSVNSDRSKLVHGLISAYGLLEVRGHEPSCKEPRRHHVLAGILSCGWLCLRPRPSQRRAPVFPGA